MIIGMDVTSIRVTNKRTLKYKGTRPSKQCGFCNYILDQSVISQDCQSGLIGQSSRGGAGCPNCPGGPGDPSGPSGSSGPSGQGGVIKFT